MKLLCLADIHSRTENLDKIKSLLHNEIDLIVVAGDLTNHGSRRIAGEILDKLSFSQAFVIPGNMDSGEVIETLEERGVNFHKKKMKLGKYCFMGLGGAKPVNTYYKSNIGELEARKYLNQLAEGEKNVVVVSHTPPYGILDKTRGGIHLGLRALTEFAKEKKPLMIICGHVHEARGVKEIGETKCINLGAFNEGNAAIVDLDSLEIEWLKVV